VEERKLVMLLVIRRSIRVSFCNLRIKYKPTQCNTLSGFFSAVKNEQKMHPSYLH
jgi:hypothetical protein